MRLFHFLGERRRIPRPAVLRKPSRMFRFRHSGSSAGCLAGTLLHRGEKRAHADSGGPEIGAFVDLDLGVQLARMGQYFLDLV